MVLVSSVFFGVNGTISKLVIEAGIQPPHLATLRATGAFVVLFAIGLFNRPRRFALGWREVPMLAGYGLAGFFLVPMLYFFAISRLPVGIGLLFEYTAPLLVAIWARFGQRRPVRARLWVGLAASLAGLASVAEVWGNFHLDPVGVAAGFTAASLLAVFYVVGAHGVTRRDPLSLTAWAFAMAALAGAIVRPWWGFPFHLLARHSDGVPVWLLSCYVVVGGSVVPYLLVTAALRHLPATSVGILGMVEPLVASTVAWLVLHEALNAPQVIGGVLVLVGVALAETARVAPVPVPATAAVELAGGG
jgi:drug/metabolite transporter (DMT)-like permease